MADVAAPAGAAAVMAEQVRALDARVALVEAKLGPVETLAATSAVRLEHISKAVDSLLATVRWVALFVIAGVVSAILNLVINRGGG